MTDYTVQAISDVVYFRVSRSLYQAARSATLLERSQRSDVGQRGNDYEGGVVGSASGPVGGGPEGLGEDSEHDLNSVTKEETDLVINH